MKNHNPISNTDTLSEECEADERRVSRAARVLNGPARANTTDQRQRAEERRRRRAHVGTTPAMRRRHTGAAPASWRASWSLAALATVILLLVISSLVHLTHEQQQPLRSAASSSVPSTSSTTATSSTSNRNDFNSAEAKASLAPGGKPPEVKKQQQASIRDNEAATSSDNKTPTTARRQVSEDASRLQQQQQQQQQVRTAPPPQNNPNNHSFSASTELINNKLTGHLRFEFQRYDGWYNNLANSNWGTPNSRLRRKVAPAYSDGVYQMADEGRPSARLLSQRMMRGEDGLASRRNLTTVFAFFGQLISSEILMASESGCPIEMHRIKIEKCDSMYDRDCRGGRTMPFYRAAYDATTGQSPNLPREQLNRVTSWIDGSFIYSTSETWLNTMRSFNGRGTLKMVDRPELGSKPSASAQASAGGGGGALGDAYLHETVSALVADGEQKSAGSSMRQLDLSGVPMSLFGYPVRNQQRAPLINHMPAHHLQMKRAERMFLLGDPRTNQNPMILSFGILFYRWHNVLAERIHTQHPDWSDEEIFQRARRLVIASLQNIFLYEYLPTLLDTPSPYERRAKGLVGATSGSRIQTNASTSSSQPEAEAAAAAEQSKQRELIDMYMSGQSLSESQYDQNDLIRPYTGYKPDLHPGISHAFQSSAFRFGHTMIPPGLYLRDDQCNFLKTAQGYKGVRLCSTWWNAEEVVSRVGIEPLLMGGASQIAEREDYVLCNDVRDKLYGPLDFSRRDLAALNIMRGRDNGLADYNTFRQAFRLPKITRWRDINPRLYERQPALFEELARLYGNRLDNIDLYIGGMLESDLERGRPGPLFRRIIKEQFERLRDSDRFWFENTDSGIFSEAEIEEIRAIKLYDIIVNATLIPDQAIQRNVFQFSSKQNDPCPQPGQLSSSELQPCYIVKGHSYFKGNEQTYLLVCLTLIAIPIVCAVCANAAVEWQERKRRLFKTRQEYERNMAASRSHSGSTRKLVPTGGGGGIDNRAFQNHEQRDGAASASDASSDSDKENDERARPATSNRTSNKCDKIYAKEWLHAELKRKIKLRFGPAPDESIYVLDRTGQLQRKLDLSRQEQASSIVLEMSVDFNASAARSSNISAAPQHPLKAAVASSAAAANLAHSSNLSLISGSSVATSSSAAADLNQLTAEDLDEPVEHKPTVLIRVAHDYDLVLQFASTQFRRKFIFKLQAFLRSINKSMTLYRVPIEIMLANAETKEKRKQRLEQFFREAYTLTFGNAHFRRNTGAGQQHQEAAGGGQQSESKVSPDIGLVMRTSLSKQEFAEALGMRADSLFVRQMFNCIDKDRNGQISFQEFLDLVVKFSRGKQDDKLRIVFDMCDHAGRGQIDKKDLVQVLRSLVDIAKTKSLKEERVMETIDDMFKSVGLDQKQLLDYEDFKLIFSQQQQQQQFQATTSGDESPLFGGHAVPQFLPIGLDMKGAKRNFFSSARELDPSRMTIVHTTSDNQSTTKQSTGLDKYAKFDQQQQQQQQKRPEVGKNAMRRLADRWRSLVTELEEHRQDIVYLMMFYVIVVVLFLERFVNYSFLSEHMDLRHVMGVGIAITRGSAASLSFCYAMLLLSMCRNIMTRIRTMSIREYIPLDSHVKFHKVVAMTALFMTIAHTIGHCINFYHVTQQPVEHLRCLTKEMQFSGESRPTFFYWVFQTVTGSTGLALWILCSIVYVFAHQRVRAKAYSFFWSTHQLYYLIYALTLLHGSSKLTGSPRFWIFFIIPATLFAIDKIMSLQAKLWQLEIFETECLPSDVIALKFARPPSFKFLSGQWVRVACTAFRPHEFHAFTLTSAPQDDFLSIHVRAHGPWTWKLRNLFDPANLKYYNRHMSKKHRMHERMPPRLRIEGPFGGGNQDWYKYEVAVMIGGGIGVTPYASILNDLVFGTSTNRYSATNYKKVYFIWICPSHKSFEWFIDVLRDVEARDVTNLLEMHIYITQFFHKFDLRTTMLYICENHFQRISNKSLFTGLKAINHFERPDIAALLQEVQNKHSRVSKVGVFSCGPKRLTKSVTEACEKVNKRRKLPFFLHQYENFS